MCSFKKWEKERESRYGRLSEFLRPASSLDIETQNPINNRSWLQNLLQNQQKRCVLNLPLKTIEDQRMCGRSKKRTNGVRLSNCWTWTRVNSLLTIRSDWSARSLYMSLYCSARVFVPAQALTRHPNPFQARLYFKTETKVYKEYMDGQELNGI